MVQETKAQKKIRVRAEREAEAQRILSENPPQGNLTDDTPADSPAVGETPAIIENNQTVEEMIAQDTEIEAKYAAEAAEVARQESLYLLQLQTEVDAYVKTVEITTVKLTQLKNQLTTAVEVGADALLWCGKAAKSVKLSDGKSTIDPWILFIMLNRHESKSKSDTGATSDKDITIAHMKDAERWLCALTTWMINAVSPTMEEMKRFVLSWKYIVQLGKGYQMTVRFDGGDTISRVSYGWDTRQNAPYDVRKIQTPQGETKGKIFVHDYLTTNHVVLQSVMGGIDLDGLLLLDIVTSARKLGGNTEEVNTHITAILTGLWNAANGIVAESNDPADIPDAETSTEPDAEKEPATA